MLFVPGIDEISHHEGEFTNDHDINAGTDLPTDVVRRLKSGALDGTR
ncbi:hypothetical protein ACFWP5_11435 [Streptomyces sp. NPDC058469]